MGASRRFRLSGLVAILLPAATPLSAQDVTPGTVQDTLRPPPEIERPQPVPDPVEAPRQRRGTPPASGRTLVVQRFVFGGNQLYSDAQLAALVADYVGRPITLLELYEAADRVAEHYQRNGYTLASVIVPAQRVTGGVVRLEVIEGRYGEVRVEGNRLYDARTVRRHLGEVPLGKPYRAGELEDGIRRLNKLPGLSARAVLRPGRLYGTSDVVVRVRETPVSGALIVDNHGRQNIGEFRFSATGTINNPLGVADQLQLLALRSEDGRLDYVYAAYSLPLNTRGDRITLSHGRAEFEVPESSIDGSNEASRLQIDVPLIDDDRTLLRISPAISRTDSTVDLFGLSTGLGTHVTLFELGMLYTRTHDNLALTQVNAELTSNFQDATATDRNAVRAKVELGVQHLYPLKPNTYGYLRFHGVWSQDPLPDTERFSLGGPTSVRGYPASEARGDRGVFGTIGLRQVYRLGSARLTGRIYADSGRAWLIDLPAGADDTFSLSSIGIGLDAAMPGPVNIKLDYAVPRDGTSNTRNVSDGRNDGRLFGSISFGF